VSSLYKASLFRARAVSPQYRSTSQLRKKNSQLPLTPITLTMAIQKIFTILCSLELEQRDKYISMIQVVQMGQPEA
jgi:hypothetical protein